MIVGSASRDRFRGWPALSIRTGSGGFPVLQHPPYSMILSARASTDGGIASPSAFAVLRFSWTSRENACSKSFGSCTHTGPAKAIPGVNARCVTLPDCRWRDRSRQRPRSRRRSRALAASKTVARGSVRASGPSAPRGCAHDGPRSTGGLYEGMTRSRAMLSHLDSAGGWYDRFMERGPDHSHTGPPRRAACRRAAADTSTLNARR